MKASSTKVVIHLILAVLVVVVIMSFLYFSRPRPGEQTTEDPCGKPPSPFYAVHSNVELALSETIKVLRGTAEPKVLDVIPPEGRKLEMIGYLSCKARGQGLIATNDELLRYTQLLGDIARGSEVRSFVTHEGTLGKLAEHFRKSTGSIVLNLDDASGKLERLYVNKITAATWQEWFAKFCAQHAGCLKCDPPPEQILKSVTISVLGELVESKESGIVQIRCYRAEPLK